jgi:hypothetical protein
MQKQCGSLLQAQSNVMAASAPLRSSFPVLPARSRCGGVAARPRTSCGCACSALPHHHHHRAVAAGAATSPEAAVTASREAVQQLHHQQQHQQQQPHAATPPPPPFAALRLLLTGQNTTLQKLTQSKPGGGPISLLLFALTVVAAVFAAIRSAIVRKVRACKTCRGFGVTRCRLCDGAGRVDWAAKLSHFDACPLCMNRRFIVCSDCGGAYQRPLFGHSRRGVSAQESSDVYAMASANGVPKEVASARND